MSDASKTISVWFFWGKLGSVPFGQFEYVCQGFVSALPWPNRASIYLLLLRFFLPISGVFGLSSDFSVIFCHFPFLIVEPSIGPYSWHARSCSMRKSFGRNN